MSSRKYPFTTDNTPTLRLLLSATTAMRAKRWLVRISFQTLEYDDRPGQLVRPFNVRGHAFAAPAGTRLLSVMPYRTTGTGDVRQHVVAGVDVLFECASDAAAFTDVPLLLTLDGAANETPLNLNASIWPEVPGTSGSPWSVRASGSSPEVVNVQPLPLVPNGSFLGLWNAATNTPMLTSGSGVPGATYYVSVPGNTTLDGNTGWVVGDEVTFNGKVWQKNPANTGVFRIGNNLSEGNKEAMHFNLGLQSFATKADDAIQIELESESGTINLSPAQVDHQILHLVGKPDGEVHLHLPAAQAGTWTVLNETTGGQEITLANTGGEFTPQMLALRPDSDELFVLNRGSASISVLDVTDNTVKRTIDLPDINAPFAMAFSPSGNALFVTSTSAAAVRQLNPDTGALVVTGYEVGATPRGLLMDPIHKCLWVACVGNSSSNRSRFARINFDDDWNYVDVEGPWILADTVGELNQSFGAANFVALPDFSRIILTGNSGSGHAGSSSAVKQFFVIDPTDNSYLHYPVGSNGAGGVALWQKDADEAFLCISRGSRSLHIFKTNPEAEEPVFNLVHGITVGDLAQNLLTIGATLYAANTGNNTLSVYNLDAVTPEEQPLIHLPYAPGALIDNGSGKIWVCFTENNAVALVDPATHTLERLVALGPLDTLVLNEPVLDVKSNGARLWKLGADVTEPAPPAIQGTRLLDLQDYFERGITRVEDTTFLAWDLGGYTTSTSKDVPYAKVVKSIGARRDTIRSDYIPVQRGARLRISAWVMRPTDVVPGDEAGNFILSLQYFDRNKRPAGSEFLLNHDPAADGEWRELAVEKVLPLAHEPIDNSDGDAICYIRVLVSVNVPPTNYTGAMQELQWGALRIDYADTARSQTLFATEATEAATIECGSDTFIIEPDDSAATVQAAIRALGEDFGAVIVSGGTTLTSGTYSGSFTFNWPPGIAPPPLSVLEPNDDTWSMRQDAPNAFLDLKDAPATYTGHAGKAVVVKSDESGLEFGEAVGGGGIEIVTEPYTGDGDAIRVTDEVGSDLAPPAFAPFSTQAQAEAGTDNATVMTPLRVKQAIQVLGGGGSGSGQAQAYLAGLRNVDVTRRLGVRAEGGEDITDLENPAESDSWQTAIESNTDYDEAEVVVVEQVTGTTEHHGIVTIVPLAPIAAPEVVEGEVRFIQANGNVTYNGVSLVPGTAISTLESALRASGTSGDATVIVSGTSAVASTEDHLAGRPFVLSYGGIEGGSSAATDGNASTHVRLYYDSEDYPVVVYDLGEARSFDRFYVQTGNVVSGSELLIRWGSSSNPMDGGTGVVILRANTVNIIKLPSTVTYRWISFTVEGSGTPSIEFKEINCSNVGTRTVTVSGAGNSALNGVFTPDSYWGFAVGNRYVVYNPTLNRWQLELGEDGDVYYYLNGRSLEGTWSVDPAYGTAPAPTVTLGAAPSGEAELDLTLRYAASAGELPAASVSGGSVTVDVVGGSPAADVVVVGI